MSAFGGALIGLAAVFMMATNGKIAGISGIASRLLPPGTLGKGNAAYAAFIAGLFLATLAFRLVTGEFPPLNQQIGILPLVLGGLLVGFGTVLGSGCTSGHGVCGISLLSVRSIIATGIFMVTAILTVFVIRHMWGG